jgi:hypothetical protein
MMESQSMFFEESIINLEINMKNKLIYFLKI